MPSERSSASAITGLKALRTNARSISLQTCIRPFCRTERVMGSTVMLADCAAALCRCVLRRARGHPAARTSAHVHRSARLRRRSPRFTSLRRPPDTRRATCSVSTPRACATARRRGSGRWGALRSEVQGGVRRGFSLGPGDIERSSAPRRRRSIRAAIAQHRDDQIADRIHLDPIPRLDHRRAVELLDDRRPVEAGAGGQVLANVDRRVDGSRRRTRPAASCASPPRASPSASPRRWRRARPACACRSPRCAG